MQQTPTSKIPRIEVVDALRGFAVLAIILVHNLEHFIFPVYPDAASQPEWLNIPFPLAIASAGRFCHIECRLLPGR